MREVRRAIQRVHVPAVFRRCVLAAALFRHHTVARKMLLQALHDQFLRSTVCFCNQVVVALHFKRHAPFKVITKQGSCFDGNIRRCFRK